MVKYRSSESDCNYRSSGRRKRRRKEGDRRHSRHDSHGKSSHHRHSRRHRRSRSGQRDDGNNSKSGRYNRSSRTPHSRSRSKSPPHSPSSHSRQRQDSAPHDGERYGTAFSPITSNNNQSLASNSTKKGSTHQTQNNAQVFNKGKQTDSPCQNKMNSLADDTRHKADSKNMPPQEGRTMKGQQQSKSNTEIIEGSDNQEKKEQTNNDISTLSNNKRRGPLLPFPPKSTKDDPIRYIHFFGYS